MCACVFIVWPCTAACMDGSYYKCTFNNKGETNVTTHNFLTFPATEHEPTEDDDGRGR